MEIETDYNQYNCVCNSIECTPPARERVCVFLCAYVRMYTRRNYKRTYAIECTHINTTRVVTAFRLQLVVLLCMLLLLLIGTT